MSLPTVSIVIPSYNRETVLIETIKDLLALEHQAIEILVVDQSLNHSAEVNQALQNFDQQGSIRWIRLSTPSIPNAMNVGAIEASGEVVLFVDDDILTRSDLVLEHARRYQEPQVKSVAGQVIQSWEQPLSDDQPSYQNGIETDPDSFMFNSALPMTVRRFIGCNVSFKRSDLLEVGGFDLNFSKVAYRYEAEAAERFVNSGRTMVFEPKASLDHLKQASGGTRSYGDHLTSFKPAHTVGMYYYYLVVPNQRRRWFNFFTSPFRNCITKFHLRKPWYIPVTLISNMLGLISAVALRLNGQRLLTEQDIKDQLTKSQAKPDE